jgi:hypothetical protein
MGLLELGKYYIVVRKLEDKFKGLEFHHVERDRNTAADALSKLGSSRTQVPPGVFIQEVPRPSISSDQAEECNVLSQSESDSNDWREPIIRYIKNEEEPDDKAAVERIARQSAHYTLIGDALYRRGATGVLMKCIPSVTGKQLLDEVYTVTPDSAGYTQHPGLWLGRSSGLVSTGRRQRVMQPS